METIHVIRFGEIWIKGRNQRMFQDALERNIRRSLKRADISFALETERGRLFVREKGAAPERAGDILARIPGIVSVSSGTRVEKNLDAIGRAALEQIGAIQPRPVSFKVDVKRADKTFPMTSPELARELGGWLLTRDIDIPVDVHHPAMRVGVEILRTGAYVHCCTRRGVGGLPVGVSGRVAVLLSGGIDSPVAAWRMQRRGADVMPIYFHGFPFTSDKGRDKVARLCRCIAGYQGRMTLHVVNFTPVLSALKKGVPEKLIIIMMRRFMMRIAGELARRRGCQALVTGDNLGQVASQTLENLACVTDASDMMILRPLLGMDKFDIIAEARSLGTFDISIEPHEDCCTLFVPKFPEIYGKIQDVRDAEAGLDVEGLVAACVSDVSYIAFKPGDPDQEAT